jgi:hypothetical protein
MKQEEASQVEAIARSTNIITSWLVRCVVQLHYYVSAANKLQA